MRFSKIMQLHLVKAVLLTLLTCSLAMTSTLDAYASKLERQIVLNRVKHEVPIKVVSDAPIKLHNDWGIPLHGTTITKIDSGTRLAKIEKFMAGQTVNLEFTQEGAYSICYFLEAAQQTNQERCFLLSVVPMKTAYRDSSTRLIAPALS